MNLSDFASIASIVSSIAVAISLIYLAMQVRQSERNQRALMQQGRADRVSDLSLRIADPSLSSIFLKGMSGDESLTAEQFGQFMNIWRAGFVSSEDSFLQHQSGHLDDAAFRSYVAGARRYFTSPGLRAAWRMSSDQYGDEYKQFMDVILRETRITKGQDQLAQWVAFVQSEKTSAAV